MNPRRLTHLTVLFTTILMLVITPTVTRADDPHIIVVTTTEDDAIPNGNCTLREAILAANTRSSVDACAGNPLTDRILLSEGVYALTVLGPGEDAGLTGDLDVHGVFALSGQGPGITVIQGFGEEVELVDRDRVLQKHGAGTLQLLNLSVSGSRAEVDGAAIYNSGEEIFLDHCVLSDNSSGQFSGYAGGAVFNEGFLWMRNSQLNGNEASRGAGLYNQGVASIQDSSFLNNTADTADRGGGISNEGEIRLDRATFNGNFSASGGAIFNQGKLILVDSHLDSNYARFYAGALENTGQAWLENISANQNNSGHADGAFRNTGDLTILNGTLSGNTSYDAGGALSSQSGQLSIENTEITNNETNGPGGGLMLAGGSARLVGVNLENNTSHLDQGGAIYSNATLLLQDSWVEGNTSAQDGGGLYLSGGTATLVDTSILSNRAELNGGGIYLAAGSLMVQDGQVNENVAVQDGGGIYSMGGVDLQNTTVSRNEIDGSGGGIYSTGSLTLVDSNVLNNTTQGAGGGIFNSGELSLLRSRVNGNWGWALTSNWQYGGGGIANPGSADIQDSTVIGNFTVGDGGGINNQGTLSLRNSSLMGNWGRNRGGGLHQEGNGQSTLENVTFSYNQGDLGGGGLSIWGGWASLNHLTITRNIVAIGFIGNQGGALDVYSSEVTIQNSLVADNRNYYGTLRATVDCHLYPTGSVTNLGYNLVGIIDGCNWTLAPGDQTGTLASPLAPILFDSGPYGGFGDTHPPKFGSPALDAGNPADCALTDQREVSRPQGSGCDVGAVEARQIALAIDIRPETLTNGIDLAGRARVSVALFSSPEFDAVSGLDRSTLTFGRSGFEDSLYRPRGKPSCTAEDTNHDGLPDLVCAFTVAQTGLQCGDPAGLLRAYGFQKELIAGEDSVSISPCP